MVVLVQLFKVDEIWSMDVEERTAKLAINTITASGDDSTYNASPSFQLAEKSLTSTSS